MQKAQDDQPAPHPYLALFTQHLDQLRDHVGGVSQLSTPSIIGGVLWTAAEKDAFFHALAVHSRFRPDLIAACVETKNEVEVLEFLALLEKGLLKSVIEDDRCRAKLPSAREVSESWIAWEEANAERLRLNEKTWTRRSGIEGAEIHGRILENTELTMHTETPFSDTGPFGGLRHLTCAHLHVLGKMLKDAADRRSGTGEASSIIDDNLAPAQPITQTGSTAPTRIFQSSTSVTLTYSLKPDSLKKSALLRSDLDPSGEDPLTHLQNLTPRSRRRYQKRIHMRQKRAQLRGEQANMTMDRLTTGPRKKLDDNTPETTVPAIASGKMGSEMAADSATSEMLTPGNDNEQTETTDMDEDTGVSDPSIITRARRQYKTAWSNLSCHSVSPEVITASGLDIFNYPKLGKLLQHFISGYDSNLTSPDVSINAEILTLLLEILKDFLTQVISRVIILEGEHQRLRGTTKVWRKNTDETQKGIIDPSAIQFSLKSMGILKANMHQYFADLLDEDCDPPNSHQSGYDDNERLSGRPNILNQHPLLQDICVPHHHYTLDRAGRQSYHPNDDTDDETLMDELEEEGVLDKEDKLADQRYERALWREVPPPRNKVRWTK